MNYINFCVLPLYFHIRCKGGGESGAIEMMAELVADSVAMVQAVK